jgi:electron transport complex protein RnfD
MNTITPLSGPHTHKNADVNTVMRTVMLALAPATVFGLYQFGWPAVNLFFITIITSILVEIGCLILANKSIGNHVADGSAILTGWLLAMSLPPWAPWWIGVLGGFIAIGVGKHVFGGIGQNVFNPAMLARVALLISFPLEMTTWVQSKSFFTEGAPDFLQGLSITFFGIADIDSVSSASLLGHVKTEFTLGHSFATAVGQTYDPLVAGLGFINGSLGETSALLLLAGGVYLLIKNIISWHIPVAMLFTVIILSSVFSLIDPARYPDPIFHTLTGGLIFAAFFIATDPVTSPSTKTGQILFGAGCGAVTFVIRSWGGYPEGIGFAVLIMNALAPLIDHYVRPRIYGRTLRGEPQQVKKAVPNAGQDKREQQQR